MVTYKKYLIAFFLFIMVGSGTQAQVRVGGQLAPVFPIGKFSRAVKAGFALGAGVKFDVKENVLAGLELNWYRFSTGFENYTNNYTTLTASLEYLFTSIAQLTPYMGLSAGVYRFSPRIQNLPVADNSVVTSLGVAPTVGVLYALQENLDLNVNLKFNIAFSKEENNAFIPLNIGLLYKFAQ